MESEKENGQTAAEPLDLLLTEIYAVQQALLRRNQDRADLSGQIRKALTAYSAATGWSQQAAIDRVVASGKRAPPPGYRPAR